MKRFLKTIIIVTSISFQTQVIAQWVHLNETFDGGFITSIKTFQGKLFVGTANFSPKHNKIFVSSDTGQTWTCVDSINGYNDSFDEFAILGNTLFISDADSGIYRSLDQGNTWSPLFYVANAHHFPICTKDSVIIVGTDFGQLFQSLDNGITWNLRDNGSLCNYIDCLGSNSTTIFAGTCFGMLASYNNGSTWSPVGFYSLRGPIINQGQYVFTTANEAWIYKSSDNGSNWIDVTNNLPEIQFIYCFGISNNNLLCSGTFGVYTTSDDGQNWIRANTGLGTTRVNGFDTLGNFIFAASNDGVYMIDTSQISLLPCDFLLASASSTPPSCDTCSDGTATAYPFYGTPPFTYVWQTNPIQTTQTATGLSNGIYSFCVTDSTGCSGCDSVWVSINVGIKNYPNTSSFSFYPNPTTGHLTIVNPVINSKAEIKVLNLLGDVEYYSILTEHKTDIEVSGLPDCLYIIQFSTSENTVIYKKFIKK